VGISRPYLANIERGELPGPAVVAALAAWYPADAEALRRLYDDARAGAAAPAGGEDELYDAMFRRSAGINPRLEGRWHALWLTTVEHEAVLAEQPLTAKWSREHLHLSNDAPSPQNPKGGYLWRAQCRLYDNTYLLGTYVAVDPLNRSKGTLYLVLHRSGTYLVGHWTGCNYDSDFAHGLVAVARDAARLPALLREHVASYPAMPYWGPPRPPTEAAAAGPGGGPRGPES
jgi:hypothetical protein